jgi:hypothetical protein
VCGGVGLTLAGSAFGGSYYLDRYVHFGDKLNNGVLTLGESVACGYYKLEEKLHCKDKFHYKDNFHCKDKLEIFNKSKTSDNIEIVGNIVIASILVILYPIGVGMDVYDDILKLKTILLNTDECCVVIRNVGVRALAYSYCIGISLFLAASGIDIAIKTYNKFSKNKKVL